ncbi:hypothetical protein DICPUDRAFT_156867 [Dictyostelium purpureum]|uniref:Uncharacterized protein n=1 Tax=Dictyostelium purpureum TaxID=5786 RepID=F0ZXN0_DICPU|nr:uncharacterized protein DICPUDRAFT_156867 [Dictyostelium purpureum]EGC31293.1 hypothetical protein DICPUDRAFT_156867 [Dictyostelium purpureum]|eukprot:XP_003292170.1 hypothetical protein DICPUDRAFT_156867 [Dictyostelium purpureum]
MKIPNYIFEYMLTCIIRYIYRFSYSPITLNNNEVINYALVSSNWFEIITKILSVIKIKNYNLLTGLIEAPISPTNQQIQKYKLIKSKDSVKVFNSFQQFNEDNNRDYRKIIFDLTHTPGLEAFKCLDMYPNDCEINLSAFRDELTSFLSDTSSSIHICKRDFSKIKKISIAEVSSDLVYRLLNINYNGEINYYDIFFYSNFKIKLHFKENSGNKINIDPLVFNPSDYNNNNNNNERVSLGILKKFSLETDFETLVVKAASNTTNNDTLEKQWDYIVNKLSTDQTLKKLTLNHTCEKGTCACFQGLDQALVYKGFAAILLNNSRVSTMELYSYIEVDQEIFKGLAGNKSIKSLSINGDSFPTIIRSVLSKNKTIRNIFVSTQNVENVIESLHLLQNNNQIDLYSITFDIRAPDIKEVLNLIKLNSYPNIQQLNIYNHHYFPSNINEIYHMKPKNTLINVVNNIEKN